MSLQVFSISIINGCDRVERKYFDLLYECSQLQIEIKEDAFRNDLLLFENFVRNQPPVFTAAGFFRLNKGLYSSLCSALVTYLIVIIQFNTVNAGHSVTNTTLG